MHGGGLLFQLQEQLGITIIDWGILVPIAISLLFDLPHGGLE